MFYYDTHQDPPSSLPAKNHISTISQSPDKAASQEVEEAWRDYCTSCFTVLGRALQSDTMRQLAAMALAFASAGGAAAFAPASSALPAVRSPNSMRSSGASLEPKARPTVSLRSGRVALKMAQTMEGRHTPKIIQGGMGVQVRHVPVAILWLHVAGISPAQLIPLPRLLRQFERVAC